LQQSRNGASLPVQGSKGQMRPGSFPIEQIIKDPLLRMAQRTPAKEIDEGGRLDDRIGRTTRGRCGYRKATPFFSKAWHARAIGRSPALLPK
jgi:hypothetical protein